MVDAQEQGKVFAGKVNSVLFSLSVVEPFVSYSSDK